MEIMIATIDFNLFPFQIGVSNAVEKLQFTCEQSSNLKNKLVNMENSDKLIKYLLYLKILYYIYSSKKLN